jgi:hypothetical protein
MSRFHVSVPLPVTPTVTLASLGPTPLVATSLYVCVLPGATTTLLPETFSPFNVIVVAPCTSQLSVAVVPCVRLPGLAMNLTITGFRVTEMLTCSVVVPPRLLAVIVYVVLAVGITALFPDAPTPPIPLSMLTLIGLFAMLQLSVVLLPSLILVSP